MHADDTIVAISSPPGAGLRGIVRITGPDAWNHCASLLADQQDLKKSMPSAPSVFRSMLSDPPIPAIVLLFAGPKSFTGQDVAEMHVPGSPALLELIVRNIIAAGARQAEPGEFSARAFFNGKVDLTQAEGIAATINATNQQQLRAAAALREGALYKWTHGVADSLGNLLALVEAGIDFTDEPGVSFIGADDLGSRLDQLWSAVEELQQTSVRLERLGSAPVVVLIGEPNVGKSSLINALTGQERAIVSPVAGTTRDMLSAVMRTERGEFRLVDVAGEEPPVDELRQKMAAARNAALLEADLVLHVIGEQEDPPLFLADHPREFPAPVIVVQNKADLIDPAVINDGWVLPGSDKPWIRVSAKTGLHLEQLRGAIEKLASHREPVASHGFTLNERHRMVLNEVERILHRAILMCRQTGMLERSPELIASELRLALDHLGEITGTISPDEVLGRIFSTFCVGK
jgi:tRNA modification GTPase